MFSKLVLALAAGSYGQSLSAMRHSALAPGNLAASACRFRFVRMHVHVPFSCYILPGPALLGMFEPDPHRAYGPVAAVRLELAPPEPGSTRIWASSWPNCGVAYKRATDLALLFCVQPELISIWAVGEKGRAR
jgi:hypothetical protein